MRIFLFVALLFTLLYGLDLILLVTLHRPWRKRHWVRRIAKWVPVASLMAGALWGLGHSYQLTGMTTLGAGSLACILVFLMSLLIALAFTSVVRGVELIADAIHRAVRHQPDVVAAEVRSSRRRFLHSTLATVPLLTGATAGYGLVRSSTPARIVPVELAYPDLAGPLDGFKILHLSDIHLGPYLDRQDLERLTHLASELEPDLVAVTGDICDHMPWYLDALTIIEQVAPAAGIVASLGNHEHFRGLGQVLRCFERSQTQLLVDDGFTVHTRAGETSAEAEVAPLFISGCDDPQWMRGPDSLARLERFVDESQQNTPSSGFRLLLSHRSQAFDFAAPLGVDLTLSGHTHGFQLGAGGRSLFETWYPDRYIWGQYTKGDSQLYTSAGVGHWFPFRLGCPPEAPLITLRSHKGTSPATAQGRVRGVTPCIPR